MFGNVITGIALLVVIVVGFFLYVNSVNRVSWNNGKCPHCKNGHWIKTLNKGYECTSCGRHMFKLFGS